MVAAQVIGNDTVITVAGQSGNFELNVMLPIIAQNLLSSLELLANSSRLLAAKAIASFSGPTVRPAPGSPRRPRINRDEVATRLASILLMSHNIHFTTQRSEVGPLTSVSSPFLARHSPGTGPPRPVLFALCLGLYLW